MTAWGEVPIGDVMAGFFDGPHATPKPSEEGPIYLGIKNMTEDGHLDLSQVRRIAWEDFQQWIRRVEPKPGDLVFTYEASLHRYAMIPPGFKGCLGRRTALIRPDQTLIEGRFLLYQFLSPQWRSEVMQRINIGSTVDRIPLLEFPKFPIRLPPLPVQRKIAAALAAYDELIENNLRRIEILEEMAQALYREWFVNFRFPDHEDVALVDSPLGPIPEGWEVTTLGEVADYISRGVSPKYDDESHAIVINQRCIRDHRVSFEATRTHSTNVKQEKQLRFGDVLVNSTGVGTLGRVAQLRRPVRNVTVDSHVTIVRPPSTVEPEYWGRALIAKESRFEGLGAGATGQTELRKSAVEATDFLLPQRAVTKRYSDLVRPFDDLAENLIAQNANLRATRDLLLPRLVSGEVDVSELEIDTDWLAS